MLILALTAFNIPAVDVTKIGAHCYQSRAVEYNDFLESNLISVEINLALLHRHIWYLNPTFQQWNIYTKGGASNTR